MTLEEILHKLRAGANDVEILKSLKLAKEAGDEVSQSTTDALGGADVGLLLDEITEQQAAWERMNEVFVNKTNDVASNEQLMDELNKLEKEQQA